MSDQSNPPTGKPRRWLVAVTAAVVTVLLVGGVFAGRAIARERQLCVAQVCVVETHATGTVLAREEGPDKFAVGACIWRGYSQLGRGHHVIRSEWDLEGDGVYDCREDDCLSGHATEASVQVPCLFRREGDRWMVESSRKSECAEPCFAELERSLEGDGP